MTNDGRQRRCSSLYITTRESSYIHYYQQKTIPSITNSAYISPSSENKFQQFIRDQSTIVAKNLKTTSNDQNVPTHQDINKTAKINKSVDFITLLPNELLYDIFRYYNIQFLDFVACTHVSTIWRTTLMNYIWPSLSVTMFFSTHPLNRLTPDEQQLINTGLLGCTKHNDGNLHKNEIFSIKAHTHERTQAVIDMGNCGLQVVDLYGSPFTAAKVFLSNANTLRELSISLSACDSYMDLKVLLTAIANSTFISVLAKICLTAAPFFDSNGGHDDTGLDGEMESDEFLLLPHSLVDISINGFSLESRLDLIKFFVKHCPHLQSLIVHPAIPRISVNIESELENIKNISPSTLRTLIF